jgi:hypothetical protein
LILGGVGEWVFVENTDTTVGEKDGSVRVGEADELIVGIKDGPIVVGAWERFVLGE